MDGNEYLNEFKIFMRDAGKSRGTIYSYIEDLRDFVKFTKNNFTDYTKYDAEDYKSNLEDKKFAVKTINRRVAAINMYSNFLESRYNIQKNFKVKPIKEQQQLFLDDVITSEDVKKMMDEAERKEDFRALALFASLYYTGMRVFEALQMTMNDVGSEMITIKGKGSKYRNVLISDKLQEIIKRYADIRKSDTKNCKEKALFVGQRGPINRQTAHRIIKQYAKICDIKLKSAHAHAFRHRFCLNMAPKVDTATLADLVGHENMNTTRIYLRKSKSDLLNIMNDIDT